jgi:hypothetical protein
VSEYTHRSSQRLRDSVGAWRTPDHQFRGNDGLESICWVIGARDGLVHGPFGELLNILCDGCELDPRQPSYSTVVVAHHGQIVWDGETGSANHMHQPKRALVIEGEDCAGLAALPAEPSRDCIAGSGAVHLNQAAADKGMGSSPAATFTLAR